MPINKAFISRNFEFYLLVILLVATIAPIKIGSVLIGLSTIAWIAFPDRKQRFNELRSRLPFVLPFLLYFLVNAVSLFYSEHHHLALKDIEGKLSFLLIPTIIFGFSQIQKDQLFKALYYYALIVCSYLLFAIVKSLFLYQTVLINQELSALVGIHASYLSLYVASAFFIILHFGDKLKAFTKWVILVFLFTGIVLLASRIVLLSIILVLSVWVAIKSFTWKSLSLLLLGFIIVIFSALNIEAVKVRVIEAVDFEDKVELDGKIEEHKTLGRTYGGRAIRVAIWDCALDVVEDNWLTGVGIGDVHDALQESYKNRVFEFAYLHNNYNAHNLFIETIIASGIFGLMTIIWLFTSLLRSAFRAPQLYFVGILFTFLFLSLMESTFNVQRGVVFFCVMMPILSLISNSRE